MVSHIVFTKVIKRVYFKSFLCFSLGDILKGIETRVVETINTISGTREPFCISTETCKFYQQCKAARCELDQGLASCFIIGLAIVGIIALTACCCKSKKYIVVNNWWSIQRTKWIKDFRSFYVAEVVDPESRNLYLTRSFTYLV